MYMCTFVTAAMRHNKLKSLLKEFVELNKGLDPVKATISGLTHLGMGDTCLFFHYAPSKYWGVATEVRGCRLCSDQMQSSPMTPVVPTYLGIPADEIIQPSVQTEDRDSDDDILIIDDNVVSE